MYTFHLIFNQNSKSNVNPPNKHSHLPSKLSLPFCEIDGIHLLLLLLLAIVQWLHEPASCGLWPARSTAAMGKYAKTTDHAVHRIVCSLKPAEYLEESHEQLQCTGVAVRRRTIEPKGLLLPSYSNAPRLVYIVQGMGINGMVLPGCPESYQSFPQTKEQSGEGMTSQSRMRRDEHQKIRQLRQGDVLAIPAGVVNWFYNNGDQPVIAITVFDINSNANQLEPSLMEFFLAGGQSMRTSHNKNIISGFDMNMLAEALGIDREIVQTIQNPKQQMGEIVRVRQGLRVLGATMRGQREEEGGFKEEMQSMRGSKSNGLEENYCFMKASENIEDPMLADMYNRRGGRLTKLTSQKLPMLRFVQMSAERGILYKNAIRAPHWHINSHSIVYALRGRCRMQVVGHRGIRVFDGEVHQGQFITVPQNFAMMMKAGSEGFEWVSFQTNDNAMVSHIAGKASIIKGLPMGVLTSAFGISMEEARMLKFSRGDEMSIFSPRCMMQNVEEEGEK